MPERYYILANSATTLHYCSECAAVVSDTMKHNEWHTKIAMASLGFGSAF